MRKATVNSAARLNLIAAASFAALAAASAPALAQKSDEEIAKAAQNPIAAMISVPLQYNYDEKFGSRETGHKNYVNVQPVIPFSISDNWNLISRTILPVVDQQNIAPGSGSQSGIGDTTESLFFSPKALTESGWTWGVGPVIYMDTASNDLGANKWGLGPTGVFLKQEHGWTYGALLNHIWSTGGSGKADINNTFMQPFLEYTNKYLTSFILQTETTYDWTRDQWSVPIHFLVSQFFKVGDQKMTFQVGARYWAASPDVAAHGWGARATLTLLFPAAK